VTRRVAAIDPCGEVLVVIRIFADTAQDAVARDEIGQQYDSQKPRVGLDL
jgi:hypothetical protein